MITDELKRLRYCYHVLQKRIKAEDAYLAYWEMNLKIVTYFLKRYDTDFSLTSCPSEAVLPPGDKEDIVRTHPLLQHPETGRGSYPTLTKELELELKRKVERYFDSRK